MLVKIKSKLNKIIFNFRFKFLVKRILKSKFPDCVLKIGANDGISGNFLYPLLMKSCNWNGIFVEPSPGPLERLRLNYKDNNKVKIIEGLIGSKFEKKDFFYLSDHEIAKHGENLPKWADQIGSFSEMHIK